PMRLGSTAAARMPMITMTTMISISVKPGAVLLVASMTFLFPPAPIKLIAHELAGNDWKPWMIHKMEGSFVKESGYYQWVFRTWPLWVLGIAAIVLTLAGGPSSPALRYERADVLAGEWWRLLSGHVVHLGVSHLVLNLAGLVLIGWIFGP